MGDMGFGNIINGLQCLTLHSAPSVFDAYSFLKYELSNMRIAFIVGQFPALSETFILNQIAGLLDRGHEVDILAYTPGADPRIHADAKKYRLLERTYYLTVYHSMQANKLFCIIKSGHLIIKNVHKKSKAMLKLLKVLKLSKPRVLFRVLYQTALVSEKGPYDVIHCHFGPSGNIAIVLKSIGALEGKIITTFHGHDVSAYIRDKGSHIYDNLFQKGDLFLVISETMRDQLIRLGCNGDKVIVHRVGVDPNKFDLSLGSNSNDGN